ncbi:MAG: hypothetical protein K6G11_02040, partial [Lachnospiraceae bacterium]|nr:hypothetical protein [Lachnospiraceae bacterium]
MARKKNNNKNNNTDNKSTQELKADKAKARESKEYESRLRNRRTKLSWEKLDNTATLFPVIATESLSNVYRIAANLTEEIIGEVLEKAVKHVIDQIPLFRMRLREGVFWYYFEENKKQMPHVKEETKIPGAYIDKSKNNQYMFRVTYYKCRINLEVFHALTDGFGGSIFLKEIIYEYLRLRHPDEFKDEKNKISPGIFLDSEDSYV